MVSRPKPYGRDADNACAAASHLRLRDPVVGYRPGTMAARSAVVRWNARLLARGFAPSHQAAAAGRGLGGPL